VLELRAFSIAGHHQVSPSFVKVLVSRCVEPCKMFEDYAGKVHPKVPWYIILRTDLPISPVFDAPCVII
jgi:hypothetical protein